MGEPNARPSAVMRRTACIVRALLLQNPNTTKHSPAQPQAHSQRRCFRHYKKGAMGRSNKGLEPTPKQTATNGNATAH